MPVLSSSPPNTLSPTTRSRTLLFISYRDSTARSSRPTRPPLNYDDAYSQADEHQRLIGTSDHDQAHVSLEMSSPPMWFVYLSSDLILFHLTAFRFISRPRFSALSPAGLKFPIRSKISSSEPMQKVRQNLRNTFSHTDRLASKPFSRCPRKASRKTCPPRLLGPKR